MGKNMKYTSERFMQDIVLALAEAVVEPIKEDLQGSPVFAFETTDVSVTKQMIIYCHFLTNREVITRFFNFSMVQQSQ